MDLPLISASEAAQAIKDGFITSEELVTACLEHIEPIEEQLGAWQFLDHGHALSQARQADRVLREGQAHGALHGVPVGIKDIFDTFDMPTENGTVLHAGRQPADDAAAVSLLRQAGAVILGKTVSTELAVYAPGKTKNPHNLEHTPGGSSSGSAAAVAAGMVPLALGTQTNGSMIRPASFCGVYGYKPSFGRISRYGVLKQSPPLDQIGVFARTIEDLALAAGELMVYDQRDPYMRLRARPPLFEQAAEELPIEPRIAFCKTTVWDQADEDTRAAFTQLAEELGGDAAEVELPEEFADVVELHRCIMEADLALSFKDEYERGKDQLSAVLREIIQRGQKVTATQYNHAAAQIPVLNQALEKIFEWHDVIMAPATIGEAPQGLDSTGSPIFCTTWTYCGMPAVSLPLLQGPNGLPLGVQLVGQKGDDARLLQTAKWLAAQFGA
jgi:Asp-tRNA(Asn)/Glu-tRNA(Gln) amidotransferase A subunit family amidase